MGEFVDETNKDELIGSVKVLGRRSKIVLSKLGDSISHDFDPKSVDFGLSSDSDGLRIFDAFFASLSMMVVSEIGDETFIIAALMAMRHPKSIVLSGALSALFVMTVLSAGLGMIVLNLIAREHTNSAATVLYAFFGMRLLYIAWRSDSKASQKKEIEELEEKLETGQGKTTARRSCLDFVLPYSWSQIATIALTTHKNAIGVALGATLGHTICTSLAVVGGRMLASKISQKTVAAVAGLLFFGLSLSSYFYPPFKRNIINLTSSEIHHFQSYCLIHSSSSSLRIDNPQPRLLNSSVDLNLRNEFSIEIIHAKLIKNGSLLQPRDGNYILNLYVKSRHLGHAQRLFDEIPHRDVQTWTIMISGFAQNGSHRMAVDLFSKMREQGVVPNHFTFSSIFKCCSSLNELRVGKSIHGSILRYGIDLDVVLANSILDFYAKCGFFDYAEELFESMAEKDTVSWNIMIGAYIKIGEMDKSMNLFKQLPFKDVASWNTIIDGHLRNGFERIALDLLYLMVEFGSVLNKVTFSIALVLVSSLSILELGRQIHGRVLRIGIHNDGFLKNSLIDMYCKCGQMEKALVVFRNSALDFRTRNSKISSDEDESVAASISWSSMVTGYIQNGRFEDALKLFNTMVCEHIEVDKFTLTSIVSACGNSGLLDFGQQIHVHILKTGHKPDVFLGSSMINMYAKCGRLVDSWTIFRHTNVQNVVLWTSMISSCASHGEGTEAIRLFELMLNEGIGPNEVTFVGVLTACSYAGLFKEGCKYFKLMKEVYGIKPSVEHFTSMVDLFGRADRLDMIEGFIYENGISHLSAVWKSFLSSCRVHRNIEMASWVSEKLLELEPFEAGPYVLLSNTCATGLRWEEAAKLRALMKERGVRKSPGQSWIQLKNKVYTFVMGDRSHPQEFEIYTYLDKLIKKLKEIGYSIDVDMVMQDVEDEQKELLLGFHSEKLAIAYGLLSTSCGTPIRVMKNLRVCTDCHNFIKYTSYLLKREIIVRDIHRYHHFRDGKCSCADY
ncbi:unnamed protein product [Camellia sinensis]